MAGGEYPTGAPDLGQNYSGIDFIPAVSLIPLSQSGIVDHGQLATPGNHTALQTVPDGRRRFLKFAGGLLISGLAVGLGVNRTRSRKPDEDPEKKTYYWGEPLNTITPVIVGADNWNVYFNLSDIEAIKRGRKVVYTVNRSGDDNPPKLTIPTLSESEGDVLFGFINDKKYAVFPLLPIDDYTPLRLKFRISARNNEDEAVEKGIRRFHLLSYHETLKSTESPRVQSEHFIDPDYLRKLRENNIRFDHFRKTTSPIYIRSSRGRAESLYNPDHGAIILPEEVFKDTDKKTKIPGYGELLGFYAEALSVLDKVSGSSNNKSEKERVLANLENSATAMDEVSNGQNDVFNIARYYDADPIQDYRTHHPSYKVLFASALTVMRYVPDHRALKWLKNFTGSEKSAAKGVINAVFDVLNFNKPGEQVFPLLLPDYQQFKAYAVEPSPK